MPENNKTEEFLQKIALCIERGELEACVKEAVRLAGEMGVEAEELLYLSTKEIGDINAFAYVLTFVAAQQCLKEVKKATAYNNAVFAAYFLGKGLILIELNERKAAWKHIKIASNLFKETGRITQSYLAQAWFYESCSKKNFNSKRFRESGEDAGKASEEYLKAVEIAEDDLKDNLTLQGNVLKARSFVRKIPAKSLYWKIYYRFGKNPCISELIDNLKNAAIYYEKASLCPVGEKDVCNACKSAISVFSDILGTMSALIKGDNAEIKKAEWLSSLERARQIYVEKKLNNGVAFVDTLKQLIKCVNELAEHRATGLHIQEERLGKCYNNLIDVSEKLDGALKIIAEHAVDAIRDYAKKHGMSFVIGEKPKESFWDSQLIKIVLAISTIIAVIIALLQFSRFDSKAWDFIKSFVFR